MLSVKICHIFILNCQKDNGKIWVCKDTYDYCLNLLFYLIPLSFLVIDNAKRFTSSTQMMIIGIHVMCIRVGVKASKPGMTKYKGFQIVHCLCWHVRCKVSRLKSELHIRWISKRSILKSKDMSRVLENDRCLLTNNRFYI